MILGKFGDFEPTWSIKKSLLPMLICLHTEKCKALIWGPASGFHQSMLVTSSDDKPRYLVWIVKSISPMWIMLSGHWIQCILSHFGSSEWVLASKWLARTFDIMYSNYHHTLGVSWNLCFEMQLQLHKNLTENHKNNNNSLWHHDRRIKINTMSWIFRKHFEL